MMDRWPRGGWRWLATFGLVLVSSASAQKFDKPFHTVVVLPAVSASRSERVLPWTLGWQYMIQERLREFPGIEVPRLQSRSDYIDQWLAGTLDVTKIAVRQQIAKDFDADLLVAPSIASGPPEWALKLDLIDLTVGPEPKELPQAKGALPTVVVDAAAAAVLKAAFGEDTITLEPWTSATPAPDVPATAVSQFVTTLALWPYTEKADGAKGQLSTVMLGLDPFLRSGSPLWLMYQRAAMATVAAGKPATGLAAVKTWAARETRGSRSHLLLGQMLAANGQDSDAVKELTLAANISRGSLPAVTALASLLKRMGQTDQALAQYQAAATMWPNVRPFQMARGELALSVDQAEEAVRAYRAAVALAPTKADGLLGLARAQMAAGRPADAAATTTELLKTLPDDPAVLELSAQAGVAAGLWDTAIAAATKLIATPGAKAEAYALLGKAQYGKQDWPAAIDALAKATKRAPKDVDLARLLGSACLMGGKPELAVTHLQASLATIEDAKRPGLQVDLAAAQFYAGQLDEGLATVRESLKLSPNQPTARYLEVRLCVYKNQLADAVKAADTALGLASGTGAALAAAIGDLEGDVKASPNMDAAKLALAYLYEAAGRAKEARQLYRAYEVKPTADPQIKTWVTERIKQIDNPRTPVGSRGTPRAT